MGTRAAPLVGLVLMGLGACTAIVGLPDVPTPADAGDDASTSGGSSASSGASGSGSSGASGSGSSGSSSSSSSSSGGSGSGAASSSGSDAGSSSGSDAGTSSGTSDAGSSGASSSGSGSGGNEGGCDAGVENCFNGVDDNCDGLVDCADPQCTGGASPVAVCVPNPGSATAGTLSTSATCPAGYPTATALNAGLGASSCAGGTCSCVNGLNGTATCSTALVSKGGTATSCNVAFGTTVFNNTSADGCLSFAALSSTTWYAVGTPALNATCNPTTGGSPIKNAPTWSTVDAFCSGGVFGTGCASGQVCAPAAANHCVLEMGNQAACSVSGYSTLNTTPFYTGYDDTGRSCACSCDLGLTCSSVVGFGSGSCNGLFAVAAGCQKGLSYDHAQISAPTGVACTPGATSSGSTSTVGFERTVCCTP